MKKLAMKKRLIGLAAAALVLTGCSDDTTTAEPPPASAQSESATTTEPKGVECATDCVDEYSAAIEALEACDTFGDAQGCDDAIRDLQALHDPILAAHGTPVAAQVGLVEVAIAEWDDDGCAAKSSCALQWTKAILEAQQLELDLTA